MRPRWWSVVGSAFLLLGLLDSKWPMVFYAPLIGLCVIVFGAVMQSRSVRRIITTSGTVKVWHADQGWGVLTSPFVSDEVWAHFSAIEGTSYRDLIDGEAVEFRYRRAHQDGYAYLAVSVRRLPNQQQVPSNEAG